MGYKAVNTLDSMLGYKNERYINFGTVSAKIDDVANFIPARITGFILIPAAAFFLGFDYKKSFKIFLRDRLNHASPNSAHGESAFAGALGVQFGGKTKYFGKVYDKPTIGDKLKDFELNDILRGRKLLYGTSVIGLIFFSLLKTLYKNKILFREKYFLFTLLVSLKMINSAMPQTYHFLAFNSLCKSRKIFQCLKILFFIIYF